MIHKLGEIFTTLFLKYLPNAFVFAPFTFGLFWKKASTFGAWAAIIVGGATWFFCYVFETRIAPTIHGNPASCVAMVIGSILKPDTTTNTERELFLSKT